jgi:N-acetylmuramoyl-L-alanine amidase/WD40 repeat protein/SH3-like domain-containing protein
VSDSEGLNVFLSYSRRDGEFVAQLSDALLHAGFNPNFDRAQHDPANVHVGISAEDEWWKRLQAMIAESDTIVFVVSPDSARSKVCDDEIQFAQQMGKRIVPVIHRHVDIQHLPPLLASLNLKISFVNDQPSAFNSALVELAEVLHRDVHWLREGARLVGRAWRWEANRKRPDDLLHGAEILEAERWAEKQPHKAPSPPALTLEYLAKSRLEENNRELSQKAAERRRVILRRSFLTAVVAAILVAVVGTTAVVLQIRGEALARSAVLARAAMEMFDRHDYVRGMRLATVGSRGDPIFSPTDLAAQAALVANARASRLEMEFRGHEGRVAGAAFDLQSQSVVTWSEDDRSIRIWDARTALQRKQLRTPTALGESIEVGFSPVGSQFVMMTRNGGAEIRSIETGDLLSNDPYLQAVSSFAYSSDGRWLFLGDTKGTIRSWSVAGSKFTDLVFQAGTAVGAIQIARNGERLLAWTTTGELGDGGTYHVWDIGSGNRIGRPISQAVRQPIPRPFDLSFDGRRLVETTGDTTSVWNVDNGRELEIDYHARRGMVGAVEFSPDASRFIVHTICGSFKQPQEVVQFDSTTGKQIGEPMSHDGCVESAAYSADGDRILTTRGDGPWVWPTEIEDWKFSDPLKLRQQGFVAGAAFAPTGDYLISWGSDKTARIWSSVAIPLNGNGSSRAGEQLAVLLHDGPVVGASFIDSGSRVLTWSEDGTARIWNADGSGLQEYFGDDQDRFSDSRRWEEGPQSAYGAEILMPRKDGPFHQWDRQASESVSADVLVRNICAKKLIGALSVNFKERALAPEKLGLKAGLRLIDRVDVASVPTLAPRLGEDVCDGLSPPRSEKSLDGSIGDGDSRQSDNRTPIKRLDWNAVPQDESPYASLRRYASMRFDRATGRSEPVTEFFSWPKKTYTSLGLPVIVLSEHGPWARIYDPYGDTAWVYGQMLSPERTFISLERGEIRSGANKTSSVVTSYPAHTIVKAVRCMDGWCEVVWEGAAGWTPRENLWGVEESTRRSAQEESVESLDMQLPHEEKLRAYESNVDRGTDEWAFRWFPLTGSGETPNLKFGDNILFHGRADGGYEVFSYTMPRLTLGRISLSFHWEVSDGADCITYLAEGVSFTALGSPGAAKDVSIEFQNIAGRKNELWFVCSSSSGFDGRISRMQVLAAPVSEKEEVHPGKVVQADATSEWKPLIVIDPGHGGKDPGAILTGLSEKDITLAAARSLRAALLKEGRFRVELTRASDEFLDIEDRVLVAAKLKPDVFISLHADYRRGPTTDLAGGASFQIVSPPSRTTNDRKPADWVMNSDAAELLSVVVSADYRKRSLALSRHLERALAESGWPIEPPEEKKKGFYVLLPPNFTAILVEMGNLASATDVALLSSAQERERLVEAMVSGLVSYYFDSD